VRQCAYIRERANGSTKQRTQRYQACYDCTMVDPLVQSCPNCDANDFLSIQSVAVDSELLECQSCKGVFELKYSPEGTVRLVSV